MKTLTVELATAIPPSEKALRGALKKRMEKVGMANHRSRFFTFHPNTVKETGVYQGPFSVYRAEFSGPDKDVERLSSGTETNLQAA